jgi:hypothetical protein
MDIAQDRVEWEDLAMRLEFSYYTTREMVVYQVIRTKILEIYNFTTQGI